MSCGYGDVEGGVFFEVFVWAKVEDVGDFDVEAEEFHLVKKIVTSRRAGGNFWRISCDWK